LPFHPAFAKRKTLAPERLTSGLVKEQGFSLKGGNHAEKAAKPAQKPH